MIGTGANSDAGVTGTVIINERNFDIRRADSKQAGEIGQQMLEAASWLVEGIATFTAEELPALLTDAAATSRVQKQKCFLESGLRRWRRSDGRLIKVIAISERSA